MDTRQNSIRLLKTLSRFQPTTRVLYENVRVASSRDIPRGCPTEYVPGLTDEAMSLYEAYQPNYSSSPFGDGTIKSGSTPIDKMTEENRKRWEEVMTYTNMTHNSRKAWEND